jgi:three-Cys-motif partner protein
VKQRASDGFRARAGGVWTREKLAYLQKYASAFMTAMGPKRSAGKWDRLVYVDLLAGPGLDIDPSTVKEFNGSPLIALAVRPKFDHLFLADKDSEHIEALKARIAPTDRSRVTITLGDCNRVVDRVIERISQRTLGLAFMDPQGFEVAFDTLAKLAQRQIDLLYLFPSGMGVRRNLRNFRVQQESPMEKFWGGRDWRELPTAKRAVSEFRRKLAGVGFKFQDEAVPVFVNTRNAQMYHLLYFSHHAIGLKIWQGIKRIAPGGQRNLPGMD